ncbi:MAG TPA: hypothetical protein PLR06_01970 [Cyclobacteriaceae bacterium]|nr:hypothetical protein [Cyclobacteriaceae bacterium]
MTPSSQFTAIYPEEVYTIPIPVIVITGDPWTKLTDEHKQLLNKILLSVRQSLTSVRIIHQSEFDVSVLPEKPARIVAFINPPKGLTTYEVIQTGETSVVFAGPLPQLITDEPARRKLWGALKTHFGI